MRGGLKVVMNVQFNIIALVGVAFEKVFPEMIFHSFYCLCCTLSFLTGKIVVDERIHKCVIKTVVAETSLQNTISESCCAYSPRLRICYLEVLVSLNPVFPV